jgi:hypothetical protein
MAGAPSPAGGLRASLPRAAARLTTPFGYLSVLGGMQVLLLWVLRVRFGTWLALAATTGLIALLGLLAVTEHHWRLKLWGITLLGTLTAIGPTLVQIVERPRIGLTMEHDGLLQLESAVDRLLEGQPIYGVDWSNTPMAAVGWNLTPGTNPALHHLAYYPLTVLVGIPFRLLTGALGMPFDYRTVLIAFAALGLIAIIALPISLEGRFLVITAIYVSPLITLYLWSGRNDPVPRGRAALARLALTRPSHAFGRRSRSGCRLETVRLGRGAVFPARAFDPVAGRPFWPRPRHRPARPCGRAGGHHPSILLRESGRVLGRRGPLHERRHPGCLPDPGLWLRGNPLRAARHRTADRQLSVQHLSDWGRGTASLAHRTRILTTPNHRPLDVGLRRAAVGGHLLRPLLQ